MIRTAGFLVVCIPLLGSLRPYGRLRGAAAPPFDLRHLGNQMIPAPYKNPIQLDTPSPNLCWSHLHLQVLPGGQAHPSAAAAAGARTPLRFRGKASTIKLLPRLGRSA